MRRLAATLIAAALPVLSLAADNAPAGTSPSAPGYGANCAARLKEYNDSVECFAPFRTAKGGVRPEAYRYCREIRQPRDCPNVVTSAPPTRYIDRAPDSRFPEPARR